MGRCSRAVASLVALWILCCGSGSGLAQIPPPAGFTPPPDAMPAQPAVPDTAMALLAGPPRWPLPEMVYVVPDSVTFGDVVTFVVDFPASDVAVSPDSLGVMADWLMPIRSPARDGARRIAVLWQRVRDLIRPYVSPNRTELEALPATAEGVRRLAIEARVLRAGPFVAIWAAPGVNASALVQVSSRLTTGDAMAPIRTPRVMGWRWWNLLLAVVIVVLLIWLSARVKARRRRVLRPVDAELSPPAWLEAALELRRLQSEDLPARGEGRVFLDRLAAVTRVFVAGRFGVGAVEMTAPEIADAMNRRGYRRREFRPFISLLSECDERRYCPDSVDAARCRELFAGALGGISTVRVEARFTPVSADLDIAGRNAWMALVSEIGLSDAGRSSVDEGGVA